jgi:hypothetical protein
MKKQLFIILSIFLFTANANANAASEYNNVLHEKNNIEFGLQSSVYSNNGILDGSTELGRIGSAIVHMGHRKFWSEPATQNGIIALSWIAPIGKGFTFLSNIIRIGAKLITKQAIKEGLKYTKSNLKLGQEMHRAYKVGDIVEGVAIKEFRLPSGKRIDFLDINNRTIYELKPFNPRAMQQGQRQLNMYMKELQTIPEYKGFNWKTVLDTY